jgi:hypothetical protein
MLITTLAAKAIASQFDVLRPLARAFAALLMIVL